MRHVRLWFVCVGFVTMSCTLEDPLSGHCGNDRELGSIDCQCVTPDTEYSSDSWSYERGLSYDNLDNCKFKHNVYAQNLGDNDIYVCLSRQCATKRCPPDTVPDDDKRKCIAKVACPDSKEVYDRDRNACQCDATKHFTGNAGSCVCEAKYVLIDGVCKEKQTCREDQVYVEADNTCTCPPEQREQSGRCVQTKTCMGVHQAYDPEKDTCVCAEGYLWFGDACIASKDCTSSPTRMISQSDAGTCTCFYRYTYIIDDCYKVGETLTFGRYPQDEDSDVPSPLVWQILDIKEDSALLISKYVLEQYTYHDEQEDITWEESNVRSYLNGFSAAFNKNHIDYDGQGFIDKAFNADEQKWIKEVTNKNPNSRWNESIPGGNDTKDKVFLLSHDEALKYFSTNQSRMASPTAYALHPPTSSGRINLPTCPITCSADNSCECSDGTRFEDNELNVQLCSSVQVKCSSTWWLRSPGKLLNRASYVLRGGGLYGTDVDVNLPGLRPALYVSLSSEF